MLAEKIISLKNKLTEFGAHQRQLTERFCAEIEFASKFAKLYPSKYNRWEKLIVKAIAAVSEALETNKRTRLGKVIHQAEEILAPIAKEAKKYVIHCIGHAHIDMNWMWSYQETVSITIDTFRTVLKLMEEFPEFCFTQSQASVYAIVKEFDSELFEQIKEKVKEGRWEIAACQWVEGDKNIASDESLVRHLLYTRKFFEDEFGLTVADLPLEWEPDTFGHASTIPSIVSRGGVKYYYMCRGGTFDKPPIFRWIGPDGRSILVNLETTWYNDTLDTHNAIAMVEFCKQTGLKDWMCVFGVGDHGGGPTRKDLRKAIEMNDWPVYPKFKFDVAKRFYEIVEKQYKEIPSLTGELNFEFTGCYTSQSRIKHANRTAENHLKEADVFSTLANRSTGFDYPSEKIRKGWINTLFGHFHDILPGSGVRQTREYQLGLFQQTIAYADQSKLSALRKITEQIDTSLSGKITSYDNNLLSFGAGVGKGVEVYEPPKVSTVKSLPAAFVIFNPTANKRNETMTLTLWDVETENEEKQFIAKLPDGKILPTQRLNKGTYWSHQYTELAVPVSADAMGYKVIVVDEGISDVDNKIKYHWQFSHVRQQYFGEYRIENEYVSFEIDKVSGGIVSLIDKTTGIEFGSKENPIAVLEYLIERPRNMSSWVINEAKEIVAPTILSVSPKFQGTYLAAIEVKLQFGNSNATITYSLKADQKWVDIDIDLNWFEVGNEQIGTPALRMKFPFNITAAKGRYEVPFSSIVRDLNTGQEVPALRWVDIFNSKLGCALLNDCKYGYSLDGSTLRANLIRSSYEPDILPEGGNYKIKFGLLPHGKKISQTELINAGSAFNHPLAVISSDVHKGKFSPTSSDIITAEPENIIISAIKKCENSSAIIVRLTETAGKTTNAKVRINKEFLGKITNVNEVDFLENEIGNSSAKIIANGFSVKIGANAIASVKAQFD